MRRFLLRYHIPTLLQLAIIAYVASGWQYFRKVRAVSFTDTTQKRCYTARPGVGYHAASCLMDFHALPPFAHRA